MTNQVITTTDAAEAALAPCRTAVADTVTRQYGAVREYAETLTRFFPSDWYMYEYGDKAEAAKGILAEAGKFRKTLRDAGHANPSVIWTRVRNEGRKLVEGEPEPRAAKVTAKAKAKATRPGRSRFARCPCDWSKTCPPCSRPASVRPRKTTSTRSRHKPRRISPRRSPPSVST